MYRKSARISECGRYRYELKRWWSERPDWVVFIGLNPSTADASVDDPTIRRCVDFTRRWGFSGMVMLNLFSYRATDPNEMKGVPVPVGPKNNLYLEKYKFEHPIVCCWGNHGGHLDRDREVANMFGERLDCFGFTKRGCPKHPLYLPKGTEPAIPLSDGERFTDIK